MAHLIPHPPENHPASLEYRLTPRPKRAFHGILDAAKLVTAGAPMVLRHAVAGEALKVEVEHQLSHGRTWESMAFRLADDGLRLSSLERRVFDAEDRAVRHERASFDAPPYLLPPSTYPEVVLPFLLGWLPLDGKRRSLYAWINDRFVARVYVESVGKKEISLPQGRQLAIEVIMYPDLNDWVHLGHVLTRLARPFTPKYHMWYQPEAPYALLRFEGPQGPPGAPELIIERA